MRRDGEKRVAVAPRTYRTYRTYCTYRTHRTPGTFRTRSTLL